MKKGLFYFSGSVISALALSLSVAQGQTPSARSNSSRNAPTSKSELRLADLLAQAGSQKRSLFSLMPSSHAVNVTGPDFSVMPMAAGPNLEVRGSGTIGRLPKWTGITSSNSFIGDSTIFEDKFGKVGIGTDSPASRLTVAGLIETTSGGVKFPDGTIQTTAGIASNDVVRSLNGLKGDLLLAGGANITITPAGNTITVAAPNALTKVAHNNTLTGEGTAASPLSVVQSASQIEPISAGAVFALTPGDFSGSAVIYAVPAGKRLVIEHVSFDCNMPIGQFIRALNIMAEPSQGAPRRHSLVPVHLGDSPPQSFFSATTPMKLYGHSGTEVSALAFRNDGSGFTVCSMSISGFLVDLP